MNWKQKQKYEALLSRERGVVKKVWGTGHTVCLAYPNAYRIGMANLGFQTVYRLFNDLPSFLCERAFWPPAGGGAESAAGGAPLVSLESQNPLRNFDLLAFSLSFENDYPAVLQMLEAAGIPLAAEDRDLAHPLVMGGGIAPTLNPEPLAAFFDLFVLGEAEEILPAFARVFAATAGLDRRDRLVALQRQLPGVYVPSLYGVSYFPEGPIRRMIPLADGLPETIRIGRIRNIGAFSTTQTVSSPDSEMADMYLVEVNRGCPHLCRFCAAGHVYAPPRFRPARDIIEAVDRGLALKGKIGLVGTAVSDHPDLADLCRHIVARGAAVGVGSLRVDRITGEMLDLLKAGRVETVALAPEAGSQRLRDLVRKDITDADILAAARLLLEKDILNLRLYFMVGLPTEEEEDIDAIIGLAKKIQHTALLSTTGQKKFRRLTLSVNQFIPKPRTPLQWCALTEVQDVNRRIRKIVSAFRRDRQITVLADVPKWNFVQALLSLGDRRVGDILLAVHRLRGNWTRALKDVNVNPDFYVYRNKALDEILPWDILEVGLPKKHLIKEYQKALSGPD